MTLALASLPPPRLAGCSSNATRQRNDVLHVGKESKSDTPALFTIPQDQMSHVQVVTVEPRHSRACCGYRRSRVQRIQDDAGDHAGRRAGSRILVVPGEHVQAGQPLLTSAARIIRSCSLRI